MSANSPSMTKNELQDVGPHSSFTGEVSETFQAAGSQFIRGMKTKVGPTQDLKEITVALWYSRKKFNRKKLGVFVIEFPAPRQNMGIEN